MSFIPAIIWAGCYCSLRFGLNCWDGVRSTASSQPYPHLWNTAPGVLNLSLASLLACACYWLAKPLPPECHLPQLIWGGVFKQATPFELKLFLGSNLPILHLLAFWKLLRNSSAFSWFLKGKLFSDIFQVLKCERFCWLPLRSHCFATSQVAFVKLAWSYAFGRSRVALLPAN